MQAKDRGITLLTPTSSEFDVSNYDKCKAYTKDKRFDAIIHTAAVANVPQCEMDPITAYRVNTMGSRNMARLAQERDAALAIVSTSYVYPGDTEPQRPYNEDDLPRYQGSMYGFTKRAGEIMARQTKPDLLTTRLGWMFGPTPEKDTRFVGTMLKKLANGERILRAVHDEKGSTVFSAHAADKLLTLVQAQKEGTRHIVNRGVITRYDLAQEIVRLWKGTAEVIPVDSGSFQPNAAQRPIYSALETKYADAKLPSWQEGLQDLHTRYPHVESFNPLSDRSGGVIFVAQ